MAKIKRKLVGTTKNGIKFYETNPQDGITRGMVRCETMRMARILVKEFLKDRGIKIGHVKSKEITKAACALIKDQPEIRRNAAIKLVEQYLL